MTLFVRCCVFVGDVQSERRWWKPRDVAAAMMTTESRGFTGAYVGYDRTMKETVALLQVGVQSQ